MPPESLPWDRKDDFRERKHERPESFGSNPRWRNSSAASYSPHYGSRDFPRWGSLDFRRPYNGKQGNWQQFEETSSHGCAASRSSDQIFGDETFRSSVSRGGFRHGRSIRDNRGSFMQRDWKSHACVANNGATNAFGRPCDMNINQRLVENMPTYPASQSDPMKTWDQFRDQHDNKVSGNKGLNTGQRRDMETSVSSMDWKPLKWTRSGSLCTRSSGFSNSSSSKSFGAVDSGEMKDENLLISATLLQSPPGNAIPSVTSDVPSDETVSRKKPRLGWGEGLAKYEKRKVDGPDVNVNQDGPTASPNSSEAVQLLASSLVDKSPKIHGFTDCASPATPSSMACSSSPGSDDNLYSKAGNANSEANNMSSSPSLGACNRLEGFCFNLKNLDDVSMANLSSSLNGLLRFADPGLVDSCFAISTVMSRLLVWKGDISKALEVTESEIDLLENELKRIRSESGNFSPCPASSSSLPDEVNANLCKELKVASAFILRPAPSHLNRSVDETVGKTPTGCSSLEEHPVKAKGEELDSQGTATSKFLEPLSFTSSRPVLVEDSGNSIRILSQDSVRSCNESCLAGNDGACAPVKSENLESTPIAKLELIVEDSWNFIRNQSQDPVLSCNESCSAGNDGASAPVESENAELVPGDDWSDDEDNILCNSIMLCNKESARQASEVFIKLLPGDCRSGNVLDLSAVAASQDTALVREGIAARRRLMRFKEKVLAIKFKAFLNAWRKEIHQLSTRRCRPRSQKKVESGLRMMNGGYTKHSTHNCSRFSSPGNLRQISFPDMVSLTSKVLSNSSPRPYRDVLKMPALILEEKEKILSRFISTNGLVEDPCAVEKEKAVMNPWTKEEEEIFMEKFATHGKDFRKIAYFLDHKTTADCIEFYYKNHKSDYFEKIKKRDGNKQEKSAANTYLVTSSKKWNRDMNAVSLDILGAVSAMAAHSDSKTACRSRFSFRIPSGKRFDLPENETVAADILAGFCGSLSAEAMSSCITSCVDPGEICRDWKSPRVDSSRKRCSMSGITQTANDDTCSDDSCGETDPGDWTDEERSLFMHALSLYGKDFSRISRCIRTRSQEQCRVFFSKARKCLGLDSILLPRNVGSSVSHHEDGDGSDTEDACILDTPSSAVCNDNLDAKMDEDSSGPPLVKSHETGGQSGHVKLGTDLNKSEVEDVQVTLDRNTSEVDDKHHAHCEDGNESVNGNCVKIQARSDKRTEEDSVRSTGAEKGKDPSTTYRVSSFAAASSAPSSSSSAGFLASDIVKVTMETRQEDALLDKSGMSITALNDDACGKQDVHDFVQDNLMENGNVTSSQKAYTSSFSGFNKFGSQPQVSVRRDSPGRAILQALDKPRTDAGLIINTEEAKQDHGFACRLDHPQNAAVPHIPLSHTLMDSGLQISSKKESDSDVNWAKACEVDAGTSATNPRPVAAQGFSLRKCNGLTPEHKAFSPEQNSGPARASSNGISESTDNSRRNGDVRLFGKILTTQENQGDDKRLLLGHEPKQSGKPSTLNVAARDSVSEQQRANVPIRSYGFWDGSRIQTGLSSLPPDSAILLAKYPAAFGNYSTSSSVKEQEQQQQELREGSRTQKAYRRRREGEFR